MFGVGDNGLINPPDPKRTFSLTQADVAVVCVTGASLQRYLQVSRQINKDSFFIVFFKSIFFLKLSTLIELHHSCCMTLAKSLVKIVIAGCRPCWLQTILSTAWIRMTRRHFRLESPWQKHFSANQPMHQQSCTRSETATSTRRSERITNVHVYFFLFKCCSH